MPEEAARTLPARADRAFRAASTSFPELKRDALSLPDPVLNPAMPEAETPTVPDAEPSSEEQQPSAPAPAQPNASEATWVRPGTGSFSSGFGKRWGRMHEGVDLAAPIGAPIYAAFDGKVDFAGPKSGFGRLVTIRHAGGLETWYGHMSVILVSPGERVKAGQIIAKVGNAGRSTGPHLHFEVHVDGTAVDPVPFMRKRGVRL
jgi:murein DD-endopeptidase MepM/ murein hydrolase activator NlpD